MSAITNAYDIERHIDAAIKAVLIENQLDAFTLYDAGEYDSSGLPILDFTKKRSRTEVITRLGQGDGRWYVVNGVKIETAWTALVTLTLYTECNMALHSEIRANLRHLMFQISRHINEVLLVHHKIQPFLQDGGTNTALLHEQGRIDSVLNFTVNVSLQKTALDALPTA